MTLLYAALAIVVVVAVVLFLRRPKRAAAVRKEQTAGTLDDAVRLRSAGDLAGARGILDAIDVAKTGGLRRFLRAVALYESNDPDGARALAAGSALPGGVPLVTARLAVAAARAKPEEVVGTDAVADLARAFAAHKAGDEAALRRAIAGLLLEDPELASIFLAKELGLEVPPSTPRAAERYASVARGRDLFAVWGAERIEAFLAFWGGHA